MTDRRILTTGGITIIFTFVSCSSYLVRSKYLSLFSLSFIFTMRIFTISDETTRKLCLTKNHHKMMVIMESSTYQPTKNNLQIMGNYRPPQKTTENDHNFFFHHTTCESTCDTLSSSDANQGDKTVSVAALHLELPKLCYV